VFTAAYFAATNKDRTSLSNILHHLPPGGHTLLGMAGQ
jgi:hypothetical protein